MTDLEQGTAPSEPTPEVEPVPTQDERTMATLAHVLQLVGWFIAPLIIFFIKRESRFVSFHALQAIFLQLVYMVFWMCFMVLWFAFIFGTAFSGGKSGPPPLIFVFIPLLWLCAMAIWLLLLVTAIVYGIRAGRGEWAAYPVIGRWARRVLNQ
ncbi:MAG: DUF4870 domain-containing protein [Terriglobales bacterium]